MRELFSISKYFREKKLRFSQILFFPHDIIYLLYEKMDKRKHRQLIFKWYNLENMLRDKNNLYQNQQCEKTHLYHCFK